MLRIILSIIVGYIAIALTVFIGLTIAYLALGSEGAFQPNVYEISTTWTVTMIAVNLVAAIIGGIICVLITRDPIAPIAFAAIVFLLGVVVAVSVILADAPEEPATRPADISMFEAMQHAQQPMWIALLNPVLVAGGIMIGASLARSRRKIEA